MGLLFSGVMVGGHDRAVVNALSRQRAFYDVYNIYTYISVWGRGIFYQVV